MTESYFPNGFVVIYLKNIDDFVSLSVKIPCGPTLPAFLSPNVTNVLVEKFGIAGITTVDDDLKLFFGDSSK